MLFLTSGLAFLLGIIPTKELLFFHPKYHTFSLLFYALIDLLKGIFATFIALLLAGWIAAYVAAILIVMISLLPIGKGNTHLIAAGSIVVLSPYLLLIGVLAFVISISITRYVSIATFFSTIAVLIFGLVLAAHVTVWLVICFLGILVCYQQRHHFRKYRRGVEKPINW